MSVQSRKAVREELGALLSTRLATIAQQVYPDQPNSFGGQSPVVVVTSAGSSRDGGPMQRAFGGPVAPRFFLDVYVFVLAVINDSNGEPITNSDQDDQLDTIEAAIAQFVSDTPRAVQWTAIGYGERTDTTFVTVIDGSEYKRERIPLVLTGK